MNLNHFDLKGRLSFVLNGIFLILMGPIYSIGNSILSVIWTILGMINAIYILFKYNQDTNYKRK